MAKFPIVQSSDGRVQRVVTSADELESLKAAGYKPVRKPEEAAGSREPINSGAEGQRRARAASTTEGSETNSGSTTS